MASAVTVTSRGFIKKFWETVGAGEVLESPCWSALMTHVPTLKSVITEPLLPDVVQRLGDPEEKTTVKPDVDVAEAVKVSLA